MKNLTKKNLIDVYNVKGLNGLYAFLRKNGVNYKREEFEFGLNTNAKTGLAKQEFLNAQTADNVLHLHYASRGVTARNGFKYTILRALQITF